MCFEGHAHCTSYSQSTLEIYGNTTALECAPDHLVLWMEKESPYLWRSFTLTHAQMMWSFSFDASSSTRDIRCTTSSSSINTSLSTRSDPVATAIHERWCLSRGKLTAMPLTLEMRACYIAIDSYGLSSGGWLRTSNYRQTVSKLLQFASVWESVRGWTRECPCVRYFRRWDKKLLISWELIELD